jgi:predicted porin
MMMPEKKGFFRLGYSQIEDKADIVAPWRGFPTGGFTRAMAQYNWYANTKTYMARVAYKFTPEFDVSLRYAIQDFDDDKANVQADSNVWHLDTVYKLTPNFYVKGRIGLVDADPDNTGKADVSYNEYRLEFNYLF